MRTLLRLALVLGALPAVLVDVLQDYDEQADVWSVGILMWQLLTGRFPFWDDIKSLSLQQVLCWRSIQQTLSCMVISNEATQDEMQHCIDFCTPS